MAPSIALATRLEWLAATRDAGRAIVLASSVHVSQHRPSAAAKRIV